MIFHDGACAPSSFNQNSTALPPRAHELQPPCSSRSTPHCRITPRSSRCKLPNRAVAKESERKRKAMASVDGRQKRQKRMLQLSSCYRWERADLASERSENVEC